MARGSPRAGVRLRRANPRRVQEKIPLASRKLNLFVSPKRLWLAAVHGATALPWPCPVRAKRATRQSPAMLGMKRGSQSFATCAQSNRADLRGSTSFLRQGFWVRAVWPDQIALPNRAFAFRLRLE